MIISAYGSSPIAIGRPNWNNVQKYALRATMRSFLKKKNNALRCCSYPSNYWRLHLSLLAQQKDDADCDRSHIVRDGAILIGVADLKIIHKNCMFLVLPYIERTHGIENNYVNEIKINNTEDMRICNICELGRDVFTTLSDT